MKRHDLLTRLLLNGNWVSFNIYNNLWGRCFILSIWGRGKLRLWAALEFIYLRLHRPLWSSQTLRPGHLTCCLPSHSVSWVKRFFDLLFGFLLSFKLIRSWTCRTSWCLVPKSCLFCNPMDCSPPASSLHGISQARIQEYVAMMYSRGSSRPRDQTFISCISAQIFYHWCRLGSACRPGAGDKSLSPSYIWTHPFPCRCCSCC